MLKGKTALVTGSTSGIGLGIAEALAAKGADVMLNGFGEADAIAGLRKQIADRFGVKVGYDGIVMAENKAAASMKLTRKDVYLALAKTVPDPANPTTLIPNPFTTWKDVNKALPATKIEVLGPPPTSGTRDSFVEMYMEAGCRTYPWLETLRSQDEPRFKRACDTVREDGSYIEAGENDNLIVQKLNANPSAIGIFGYSFLEENLDKLKGAEVDGVTPTF